MLTELETRVLAGVEVRFDVSGHLGSYPSKDVVERVFSVTLFEDLQQIMREVAVL